MAPFSRVGASSKPGAIHIAGITIVKDVEDFAITPFEVPVEVAA